MNFDFRFEFAEDHDASRVFDVIDARSVVWTCGVDRVFFLVFEDARICEVLIDASVRAYAEL
jgi:hypothetical protein